MFNIGEKEILNHPRSKIINRINHHLGNINGIVADIGCGSGYFSILIAKNFKKIQKIDAIEASEVAINKVIPKFIKSHNFEGKINPILGSFDSLPNDKYNCIFAMGALHHSTNLKKTFKSIYRSLKEGGYLIAQEPTMPDITKHSEYEKKYNIVEERYGLKIRNGDRYDRFFRECEYKSALILSGFDLLVWEDFKFHKPKYNFEMIDVTNNYLKKYGLIKTIKKINSKVINKFQKKEDNWKDSMSLSTNNLKPKLFIAKKSNNKNIYHDD
jgi:SAM-dependent methyltransferase